MPAPWWFAFFTVRVTTFPLTAETVPWTSTVHFFGLLALPCPLPCELFPDPPPAPSGLLAAAAAGSAAMARAMIPIVIFLDICKASLPGCPGGGTQDDASSWWLTSELDVCSMASGGAQAWAPRRLAA